METRVVHFKKEKCDVYIGRPSKWGNPFSHIPTGTKAQFVVATRAEAIKEYEKWIMTQPQLLAALPELEGKVLGCWCKPKACHGDVLVKLLNNIMNEELTISTRFENGGPSPLEVVQQVYQTTIDKLIKSKADMVVTNTLIGTLLQDNAGFEFIPIKQVEFANIDHSRKYEIGTLMQGTIMVKVDPIMAFTDNRLLFFKDNTPVGIITVTNLKSSII